MKYLVINNVELEDIENMMDKVNSATEKLSNELPKGEKAKNIEAQIIPIRRFFNGIWGEGTSEKVFGDTKNPLIYFKALQNVFDRCDQLEYES